jgi:hypothetical protein
MPFGKFEVHSNEGNDIPFFGIWTRNLSYVVADIRDAAFAVSPIAAFAPCSTPAAA